MQQSPSRNHFVLQPMPDGRTAFAKVRDRLREDILSGYLAPGAKLTIAPLAERYGTSPMPIRAAIQELQGLGLVDASPHKGARVRIADETYITNIYELRGAILGLLMPRCVRFITNAEIEEIEVIQDDLEKSIKAGDVARTLEINHRFHHAIHRIARNPEALAAMERTWVLLDALRWRFGFGPNRLAEASASHRALIKALAKRDGALATKIAKASSDRAMLDLIRLAKSTLGS